MAIPTLDQDGRLPPGRHPATMSEIAHIFVERAPHRARRRLIFDAFDVYTRLVAELLPGSYVWVNGGFVTHKADPPKDIDLVIVVNPTSASPTLTLNQLLPLLTQTNIDMDDRVGPQPGGRLQTPVLHPMGGLVDAYLVTAGNAAMLTYWDDWWSKVNGNPAAVKGYLEVTI